MKIFRFRDRIWLCFVLPAMFCMTCAAQGAGVITGRITDEKGMAVAAAKVSVLPLNGRPEGSGIRYVDTDAQGRFAIDRLTWGKYSVFAMKEDAGYPDMEPSFYSANTQIPVATITPAAPIARVSIRLGPRAAILEGSVSDALTGAPINAFFRLMRTSHKQDLLLTSLPSTYRVLLPPDTSISLSVTATGYKEWILPNPINLRSTAKLRLDVQLAPAYNPNLSTSQFLVPEGYVGWVIVVFNQKKAPSAPTEGGVVVFKVGPNGPLETSSADPDPGARQTYGYYSSDGSVREVPMDYRNGGGVIWGQYDGFAGGVRSEFGFFVGTQEQYLQAKNKRRVIR